MSTETLSYSRVDTWAQCPYHYCLRYRMGLKPAPKYDPQDPLILGTAFHTALEKGMEDAEREYYSQYPIIGTEHSLEMLKLSRISDSARNLLERLCDGEEPMFERAIYDAHLDWIGYVDCIVPRADGSYRIIDFKYASEKGASRYSTSSQLPVYKKFVEKVLKAKVSDIVYLVAPKVTLRRDKDETDEHLRLRTIEALDSYSGAFEVRPSIKIDNAWEDYIAECGMLRASTEYPKNPSPLCRWCEYQRYCESNGIDLTEIQL